MAVVEVVLVAMSARLALDVLKVVIVEVVIADIVVGVHVVKNAINVKLAIYVTVVAILAMMYIVGAIGLHLIVVVAELEIKNRIQIGFNYLSNIAYGKFRKH